MKKLLFLLLLIPFLGTSQGTFTAPVGYNTGTPTAAPSGVGTRWRFDLLTGKKYTWNPDAVAWDEDPRGIDQISGCSAPMYTPGYNQSTFAVNSCSTPELYQYYSSAWHCLNCGGGTNISAGSGISIAGTPPDITISADDNSPTNELQTLSISGSDLTLSNGGGTVAIPGGGSLGTGFTAGGGSGTIPTNTTAAYNGNTSLEFTEDCMSYGTPGIQTKYLQGSDFAGIGVTYDPDNEAPLVVLRAANGSGAGLMNFSPNGILFAGNSFYADTKQITLSISDGGSNARFEDLRTIKKGLEYDAEYPNILTNARSIPDVGLVKELIADSLATISSDALGTGFTAGGGSGTIPDGTTATLEGGFIISNSAGYFILDGTGVGEGVRAAFGPNGIQYTQDSENYLFDFNPADGYIEFRSPGGSLTLNPASSTLSSVGVQPISYTNAAAPSNTIFYSTTDSKLSYKDPGGTVHGLY